jgi:hypothetical protein
VNDRAVAVVQLIVAVAAAVGCVLSWLSARSLEVVAPIIEGEPTKSTTVYDPPMMALAFLLAAVAGVAVVSGVARLRRRGSGGAAVAPSWSTLHYRP